MVLDMIIKYILALIVVFFGISVINVVWPKFTANPRPNSLELFNSKIKDTRIHKDISNVLGVTTESSPAQIDLKSMTIGFTGSLYKFVEGRAQKTVITHALNQLMKQYQNLTEEQKSQVKELICTTCDQEKSATKSSSN